MVGSGPGAFSGTIKTESTGDTVTVNKALYDWDQEDASVICRQLGRGLSGVARDIPLSRPSLAKIHYRSVHCHGEELDLLQCPRTHWNGGECAVAAGVTCTQQKEQVPVRLVGGHSKSEGRVEVFHAGQWGSICDDQWDDNDAEVVCRQLGLSGVARAWGQARFGKGSGPVWLDEVECTGNELTLEQCPKSIWGEHNCVHLEDAGVSCTPLTDGTVRLAGGTGSHEGRLEVFYQGQWGTVCDDGWTDSNTKVVCRQLGYRFGVTVSSQGQFGTGSGPILLDDVSCTGKEPSLMLCNKQEWLHHDCTHHEDVSLACNPERSGENFPSKIPIRLVGGESPGEGRVELYLSGQWGTVCDDGWSDHDAEVVCRQLGFSGVAKARVMAYFGEGTGPSMWTIEDAGVICNYGAQRQAFKEDKDPVSSICGLKLIHTRQRRIIGGENSLRGGWPWQAAIRLRGSRGDGRLVCGATLIDTCWVLTSAHCFKRYGNSTREYKVRVGDYHSLVPEEYEEEYGVDQIVPHPNYQTTSNDYDIALVRLSPGAMGHAPGECVSFNRHVLPACLPHRKERVLKQATNCHITGWGDTGRSYSKTLQQAPLELLPRRHCQLHFHSAFTSRMLCAGSLHTDRRVDSCRGDSGGPLVCERPGGDGWFMGSRPGAWPAGLNGRRAYTLKCPPSAPGYTRPLVSLTERGNDGPFLL
ncbi:hypothetical protein WMY93_006048 [Mugilogobius chulae]|uniref:Neurotrypsin n=1 Tax=Mugilogobius chulae TaxID=88201 RepID=A0AAW0PPZ3_9GOBI